MKITISLVDSDGGTEVVGVHEGLPPGVSIADNQAGWQSSLARLAALVEDEESESRPGPVFGNEAPMTCQVISGSWCCSRR